jgi:predicted metal-dependent HD superfamily phosphohydrolase
MDYAQTTIDAELFVRRLFDTFSDKEFPYHNLDHTVKVVGHVREIGTFYALPEEDLFILQVAAWFHDIGHLFGPMEEHEENGVHIMTNFFSGMSMPSSILPAISGCILATKWPVHPHTLNEEILCDADTYHFGTEYFTKTDPAVKQEMELRLSTKIPDWHKKSLWLLQNHHFFTSYCQQKLEPGKQKNIAWLQSLIES